MTTTKRAKRVVTTTTVLAASVCDVASSARSAPTPHANPDER